MSAAFQSPAAISASATARNAACAPSASGVSFTMARTSFAPSAAVLGSLTSAVPSLRPTMRRSGAVSASSYARLRGATSIRFTLAAASALAWTLLEAAMSRHSRFAPARSPAFASASASKSRTATSPSFEPPRSSIFAAAAWSPLATAL